MRRSSIHAGWLCWCGIFGVATCLEVFAGDKVIVSGPKKQADETIEDKTAKDDNTRGRGSFFDLLRAKPSVLNPFNQGESLGGAIIAPITVSPSIPMDEAGQKRIMEKLTERRNWLQDGMRSTESPINTLDGISANTNSFEMFLTPSQKARSKLGLGNELGSSALDSKKPEFSRRISPLEMQSQVLNGDSSSSSKSEDNGDRPEKFDGGATREELGVFGFIHDQVGEKSMFEFESQKSSHEYGQNGFLPGFSSASEGPKNTMFGNHVQLESQAAFGGGNATANPTAAFGVDAFGTSAFDAGNKPAFNFGAEGSPAFGTGPAPRSAFAAPDPVIARPIQAPAFTPRPAILPTPSRGL